MIIVPVTEENLLDAAAVHAAAWRESHRAICSPEFVAAHTTERQAGYIRQEMARGKRFFLLAEDGPKAVVSVEGNVIADLYVHPAYQRQGYGSRLLEYAAAQCAGQPTLWVLNTNEGARRLYERARFVPTGRTKRLSDTLYEVEMAREPNTNGRSD